MSLNAVLVSAVVAPFVAWSAARTPLVDRTSAPAKLQITLTTVHAAALTTPRAAGDALDEPYLLLSEMWSADAVRTMTFPATERMPIQLDQALPARPLHALTLEDGQRVRVLLTALEGPRLMASEESAVAAAAAQVIPMAQDARASALKSALAPAVTKGSQLIGAAILEMHNEGGMLYWRTLECVADCSVLTAPAAAALDATKPTQGLLELTGAGGTYHFNMHSRRVQ